MLVPGSVPRAKQDVANYLAYLDGLVERTQAAGGLDVRLGTPVSAGQLEDRGYDVVVCCTGAELSRPGVAGVDGDTVVSGVDLLLDPSRAADADHIVVVGGGAVGCEVAFWLAAERGRQVTVLEMLPWFMKGNCTANRGYLLHYLEKLGVGLLNCTRLRGVNDGEVSVVRNVSPTVPDPFVTWAPLLPENIRTPLARRLHVEEVEQTLPADLVVLATGLRPANGLYEDCVRRRAAPALHNIGDSFAVGNVREAVRAGYLLGRRL